MLSYLLSCLLYFALPEVKETKRKVDNKNHIRDIFDLCFKTLKNQELRIIILSFAVISSNFAVFHWGLQPLMLENKIPEVMFSIVTGTALLACSFWSIVAGKLLAKKCEWREFFPKKRSPSCQKTH